MKITGNTIRDAVKSWELRKATLETLFQDSLFAFDDEKKKTPLEISDQIYAAEQKIVSLQVAQLAFNSSTYVESSQLGRKVSLSELVKLVGALERMTKLWSETLPKKEKSPYRSASAPVAPTRSTTQIVANDAVGLEGKATQTEKYRKLLGHLKGLISEGNNQVVSSSVVLDPSLLE